jgi:surface polysaccharide O-acyltransferase-like enzyme
MISGATVKYDLSEHIEDYFFKATMIFFIQMLIITFIAIAALTNTDGLEYVQPNTRSLSLRLLCCYLFHLSNYGDVADSFRRLKYLKENPDKF